MNLEGLVKHIINLDTEFKAAANKAVNTLLTLRNWLIGYYIVEFEQNGEDRAVYGDKLIERMATALNDVKGIDKRALFKFKQFYLMYPQIADALDISFLNKLGLNRKVGSMTTLLPDKLIVGSATTQLEAGDGLTGITLITSLSYTHIEQLLTITDTPKRLFYEIECIKGTWSVRELKRQINSLYYERASLSSSPQELSNITHQKTKPEPSINLIKNVYAFEFLGIHAPETLEETDLETALLNHLREFILELGNGFCLEARQKRILIGDEYFFIDLVFYHRILKCHVLIELKVEEFTHANAGQLNTYLNYYKQEVKTEGDNDPVGILLVTNKNEALVKYATVGMDLNLFVSKYLLQLPSTETLQAFIQQELKSL